MARIERMTPDLSQYPDLVMILLGVRVRVRVRVRTLRELESLERWTRSEPHREW